MNEKRKSLEGEVLPPDALKLIRVLQGELQDVSDQLPGDSVSGDRLLGISTDLRLFISDYEKEIARLRWVELSREVIDTGEGITKRPTHDGCEWNSLLKRAVYANDPHYLSTHASIIVGYNGKWRLCTECAALPEFKRFRSRRPVRK